MENVYLGRQPILDNNLDLCAYEIVYRDMDAKVHINSDRFASVSVINSILNKFGTKAILGVRKAFIKIDEKFLLSDMIFTIPKEFFIFSILYKVNMSERVVERIQQLHSKGYELAINDMKLDEEIINKYKIIFKELSYIKINLTHDLSLRLKDIILEMQNNNIKVVAAKIETRNEYVLAQELGCNWFQGYFFAEPKIMKNAKYEASHMNVFRLYNLLLQDTNIDEIVKDFENNPELTVQLLQFINSGIFHFRKRISSIHHVLTLIGRVPLSQWLMLMIYSKSVSKSKGHSPVMLMVIHRTELMEKILKEVKPNVRSNMLGEAYFIGLLSLVDVVLGIKLEDILKQIHISDKVKNALLNHEGLLGEIFILVKDIEAFNTKNIVAFEKKYNLKSDAIENIVMQSMEGVTEFEQINV